MKHQAARRSIMVSNGMSSRRTTLKRPIVCKSKKRGDCGACEFFVHIDVADVQPNENTDFVFDLTCDPNPTDEDFTLYTQGAFTPLEPAPTLTVNIQNDWHLQAPSAVGDYIQKFQAVNSSKCIHLFEIAVKVVP